MNELALFAGAGGGLLGSILLGHRTVCAVEIEPYCREVLLRRQRDGLLPVFPIWDDIRSFDGKPWRGAVDLVSAGFPCQPFSVAGKRKGDTDERNMWPDTIRVIREVGPSLAFLENVPGLVRHEYFGQILGDLAEAGFDAEWDVVSAAETGAPHIRERLWIMAYAGCLGIDGIQSVAKSRREDPAITRNGCEVVSHADRERFQERREPNGQPKAGIEASRRRDADRRDQDVADSKIRTERFVHGEARRSGSSQAGRACGESHGNDWWESEPDVGRVAHGVASRVDRLRALGNGQVPAVVARAWEILMASTPGGSRE